MLTIDKDSILFVCYGGGHAAALLPVVKRMRRAGQAISTLALTTAARNFYAEGLPFSRVADVYDLVPSYRKAPIIGRLLAKSLTSHPIVSEEETAAYLGVGFHSLVKAHGLREARRLYADRGRQCLRPTDFYRELFRKVTPKIVVATSAPRTERAVFEAARELGIPSLCVVDLYAPYEIEWCSEKGYATKYCVLNSAVKQRFIAAGVKEDLIFDTGNPAFDRLASIDRGYVRSVARARMGLNESEKLVVWVSQPEPLRHPFGGMVGDPQYPQRVERYLAETFGGDKSVHLVMRLHPSEHREPAVSGPRIRYGDSTEPLDELLSAADCVITASSTVGLEAAILGIPVVQCMDSIFSADLPLGELGVAASVARFDLLSPEVSRVLSGGVVSVNLDYRSDGNAAARIEEQILGLLTK